MGKPAVAVTSCCVAACVTCTAVASADVPEVAPTPATNRDLLVHGIGAKPPLSDDDLSNKKEGGYFTGLPLVNYDSDVGFGFGARAYYYFDGSRSDPRFAYTPYLHRAYAQVYGTTGGQQVHSLDYDAPFIGSTPLRLRATLQYERNTSQRYYGRGAGTLAPLTFMGAGRTFDSAEDYDKALASVRPDGTTLARYNTYLFERPRLHVGLEHSLLGGVLRTFVAVTAAHVTVRDYTGESVTATAANGAEVDAPMGHTRLRDDCDAGRIVGCDGGFDNRLRVGIALDTRDYEPDPNSGVFVDLAGEFSTKALGSAHSYGRVTFTPRAYFSPFPKLTDLVLAVRGSITASSGDTPFYAMNAFAFSDGTVNGLGGLRTLRGFRQDRFVGPIATLFTAEVRWWFWKFDAVKQHFALGVVPFLDMGRVYDKMRDLTLAGWKRGQGAGLRIAWNQATIVVVDFGASAESTGLYIDFNHVF